MSKLPNLYHTLLKRFHREKVEYLIIGVSAINYFAKDARQILSTADYDLFLRPTAENVLRAVRAFQEEHYRPAITDASGGLKSLGKITLSQAKRLAQTQRTLVAVGPYELVVEALLAVSGFTFEAMWKNAVWMRDDDLKFKFPVANLPDLLESKRIANRDKDRLFLAKYKRLLEEF